MPGHRGAATPPMPACQMWTAEKLRHNDLIAHGVTHPGPKLSDSSNGACDWSGESQRFQVTSGCVFKA